MKVPRQATTATTTSARTSSSTTSTSASTTSTTTLLTVTTTTTTIAPSISTTSTVTGGTIVVTSTTTSQSSTSKSTQTSGTSTTTATVIATTSSSPTISPPSATSAPPTEGESNGHQLNVQQTVGITAGVIAAVFILLILGVLLHRCLQSKRSASARRSQSLSSPCSVTELPRAHPPFAPAAGASFAGMGATLSAPFSRLNSMIRSIPPSRPEYRNTYLNSDKHASMQTGDVRIVINRGQGQRAIKARPWNSGLWPIPPGYAERFTFFNSRTSRTGSDLGSERANWSTRSTGASTRTGLESTSESEPRDQGIPPVPPISAMRYENMQPRAPPDTVGYGDRMNVNGNGKGGGNARRAPEMQSVSALSDMTTPNRVGAPHSASGSIMRWSRFGN